MVYRRQHQRFVKTLLWELGTRTDVRLWALDEVAPELESYTLGCGPGLRFSHLNGLFRAKPIRDGSWVVIADDDVFFTKGSIQQTINLMMKAGLSLAQPGHSVWGWWTNVYNIARPLLIARDSNYVEQGPLIIAAPDFVHRIFPLPEEGDMGWGIEAEWYQQKHGRQRFGVVDACHVVHWYRNATSYAIEPELEKMNQRLAVAGINSIWQLLTANGYWWRWQRVPPWNIKSEA
jgi:hypothetical protein